MPRVTRQQADQHRRDIEEASARLFRERGLNGVSVAEVMAAAGLTHGGFYGHFASKECLAAQACERAFSQAAQRWTERVAAAGDPAAAHHAIVGHYLTPASRDVAGQACPAPALAADVAREPPTAPIRASFAAGLDRLACLLASLQPAAEAPPARRHALAELATLTGALVLARATAGQPLSDEILSAARQALGLPSLEA